MASISPYVKFCSIECVDEGYKNRGLDDTTLNYAAKRVSSYLRLRKRELSEALSELFFIEILKINRLLSNKEYEEHKKEILGDDQEK